MQRKRCAVVRAKRSEFLAGIAPFIETPHRHASTWTIPQFYEDMHTAITDGGYKSQYILFVLYILTARLTFTLVNPVFLFYLSNLPTFQRSNVQTF
ncbi:MAG TPA: hypothetical protein VLD65_01645 [Anaerolineales bacterium]|nr:hypothetical protein [Anaerolineales bacterium]